MIKNDFPFESILSEELISEIESALEDAVEMIDKAELAESIASSYLIAEEQVEKIAA